MINVAADDHSAIFPTDVKITTKAIAQPECDAAGSTYHKVEEHQQQQVSTFLEAGTSAFVLLFCSKTNKIQIN